MSWFDWVVVIGFFAYIGFVYYHARKRRNSKTGE